MSRRGATIACARHRRRVNFFASHFPARPRQKKSRSFTRALIQFERQSAEREKKDDIRVGKNNGRLRKNWLLIPRRFWISNLTPGHLRFAGGGGGVAFLFSSRVPFSLCGGESNAHADPTRAEGFASDD